MHSNRVQLVMWPALLAGTLLFLTPNVSAQEEVGKTVSKEGEKEKEPEFKKPPTPTFKPVPLKQRVEVKEQLRTKKEDPSKLGILLDAGSTVSMSKDVEVEVASQDKTKVTLRLTNGTIRVLEVSKTS